MQREEFAAWLRLALTPGVGNVTARRLLAAFGLPHAIFEQDPEALEQVVGRAQAAALRQEPEGFSAQFDRTAAWLAQDTARHAVVTLGDAHYPAPLLHLADPPLLLYRLGLAAPLPAAAIAVVGSRNPTPQGLQNARRFGQAFAEAGVTVVSGMALGVDGAAHEGALAGAAEGAFATVAVIGTGLDRVYPRRHLELAHRVADRGAILSEYPLGTPPLAENFPKRNRLIAALGQGTLVVEAALQSGSLITARLAADLGRDVFAIPGSIHSPQARGCHLLLRQGAKLVETAQDVLEDLRLVPAPVAAAGADEAEGPASAPGEHPVLVAMGYDPVGLDALIARTGIAAPQLQATLLELELAGDVARLPGGLFQRIASA